MRKRDYIIVEAPARRVLVKSIQTEVARFYRIPQRLMQTKRRDGVGPRQVAMYLARKLTSQSLPQIGDKFGGRDHTTVIWAIKQVEAKRAHDADLDAAIDTLTQRLAA